MTSSSVSEASGNIIVIAAVGAAVILGGELLLLVMLAYCWVLWLYCGCGCCMLVGRLEDTNSFCFANFSKRHFPVLFHEFMPFKLYNVESTSWRLFTNTFTHKCFCRFKKLCRPAARVLHVPSTPPPTAIYQSGGVPEPCGH